MCSYSIVACACANDDMLVQYLVIIPCLGVCFSVAKYHSFGNKAKGLTQLFFYRQLWIRSHQKQVGGVVIAFPPLVVHRVYLITSRN